METKRVRPIPKVDPFGPEYKHLLTPGTITTKPRSKDDAVSLEMHYCTAYLSRKEALQVLMSLAHAGYKQWGLEFIQDSQRWLNHISRQ